MADTTRYIKFAHAYFAEPNGAKAAKAAGYKGDAESRRRTASRVLKRPEVQAELARLAQQTEGAAVAARKEALETLTRQLRLDLGPYLIFKDGVLERIDLQKMQADGRTYLLQGVEVTDDGRLKVKLPDKQRAIELLAKLEGWMAPREHRVAQVDVAELSDAELERKAKELGIQV